jgi:hypothetical protein
LTTIVVFDNGHQLLIDGLTPTQHNRLEMALDDRAITTIYEPARLFDGVGYTDVTRTFADFSKVTAVFKMEV